MASSPPSDLGLDSKLGAAFLGNTAAAIFYGITSVQTYIFFRSSENDRRTFKALILFLWILDTLHLALVTHALYFYMITNFANPEAVVVPSWSILAQVYVTCISDLIVRGVFARRVWLLSGKKYFLVILIAVFSLLTAIVGFGKSSNMNELQLELTNWPALTPVFASKAFELGSFLAFQSISWMMYTALSSGVASDVVIAVSLVTALLRSRTGFKRADSLVNTLMLYTINTGLFTTFVPVSESLCILTCIASLCTGLCFITYAIWPAELIFMGFYFCLSALYLNALLATLNARSSLRDKQHGVSTVPLELNTWNTGSVVSKYPSHIVPSHDENSRHNSNLPRQQLIITVDQKIETTR
ncbi:hypothetical protein CCMSSC00406_0008748 [Pleurotus cornucopiae]|uniref:Uncharacterized protein n=1 Tax=Pleurotus cornucopiae TaxID=5321 RepID=A0ACB7J6S3_PLECO|nr:hypothetical protein CCMSSC00406_0008748 [Pleurotus cornucopiae]